ncbi:hypothetical protein R3I93_010609 [Phoxinus phoxinus]|uniref:Uncharacterized protein n=1 Tax=Phoxinus phoxinus TaxID=58324 RepID=A0AAN9H5B6_9TELE
MSERDQKRSPDPIVHCLRCHKPQENLSVHLARVCMKNGSTPEERTQEVQKAKASSQEWIRNSRTWDYRDLREILPDTHSRVIMVEELQRRGFFITNQPQESHTALDPESDSDTTDRDPASTETSSVRIKMKEAGLYGKFPAHAKLLVDFKKYLTKSLRISNWQNKVDNVSRFLRYVQPTASEPSLDFLSKRTETRDFLTALQRTDMGTTSLNNYIKSIIRFLEYLTTRLDLCRTEPELRSKCKSYTNMLKTLRKTVSKTHDKTWDTRHRRFGDRARSIRDCQGILRVAQSDFLRIHGDLLKGTAVSNPEKTLYRCYCEALLVYRHMQCPGAITGLTDEDWVERIAQGGRVVIGARKEKTASMRIALTQEEEACFQLYYKQIRPGNIRLGKFCRAFFLLSSGAAVSNVSRDMSNLHEMYKLACVNSQDVRRAVGSASQKLLMAHRREAVNLYLARDAGNPTPQDTVDAAVLLDSLSGASSDDDTSLAELSSAGSSIEEHASRKDFPAFIARFPVSLEGQPPSKKQRVDSGFPGGRVLSDKWRSSQYKKREEHLLSRFTHRKASAAEVARLIAQEGWQGNYPKPEEVVRLWRPAPPDSIEANQVIIKCVSEQAWTGLAVKDFGDEHGLGVVATRPFSKGDVVCDFHGEVIPAAEGRAMMMTKGLRDLFFFRAGHRELCVDGQTPCECHPDTHPVGRRITHSQSPNLEPLHCVLKLRGRPRDVILLRALADISVDTQLKFYSGEIIKSFLGLELDWLDE